MQTKLIKLTEGYIIVSDINIQDKNIKYILSPSNEINTFKSFETGIGTTEICWIKVKETTTLQQVLNSQKIIASTFIPKLPNIDFNNLEEELGITNIEKLANEQFTKDTDKIPVPTSHWYNSQDIQFYSFMKGFNKCLELNKDKLYTEEQLRIELQALAGEVATEDGQLTSCGPSLIYSWIEYRIQSLQPKTEWDIEIFEQIEDNKIKIIKIL